MENLSPGRTYTTEDAFRGINSDPPGLSAQERDIQIGHSLKTTYPTKKVPSAFFVSYQEEPTREKATYTEDKLNYENSR